MDCIIRESTYAYGTLCDSVMIAEDKSGKQTHLLNGLTLEVKDGRYRLTNAAGSVLRQGLSDGSPESIFEIYDTAQLDVFNMEVVTDDFNGSFEQYELKHGFGRIAPEVKRKLYCFTEATEGYTAIGIAELKGGYTQSIHSLYIPQAMSRKERTEYLCEYIYGLLAPPEYASITETGFGFDRVNIFSYGNGALKAYPLAKESNHAEQPHLLAIQAAERKESIAETFEQGIRYKVEGIFAEDETEEGKDNATQDA